MSVEADFVAMVELGGGVARPVEGLLRSSGFGPWHHTKLALVMFVVHWGGGGRRTGS